MTLVIVPRDGAGRVIDDLRQACPEPGLSISSSGVVGIVGATTVCGRIVEALVNAPMYTGIRVEPASFRIRNPATGTSESISAFGGVTVVDRSSSVPSVQVIYDGSNCNGNGYFTMGEVGGGTGAIDMTPVIILVHELAHAGAVAIGQDSRTGDRAADSAANEAFAIGAENLYRAERGLPKRTSHTGACKAPAEKPKQEPKKTPPGSKSGCFVATAAHGSALHPEVEALRQVRDGVVRRTRMGREYFDQFFSLYAEVSPQIIAAMDAEPAVKTTVRQTIVAPIVNYLALFESFPDAPLDDVPEPWRSWLEQMQVGLEEFVAFVPLPEQFDGLSALEAIDEINLVLRYAVRSPERRAAWLLELAHNGVLPLAVSEGDYPLAAEGLRDAGRTEAEVEQIIGCPPIARSRDVVMDAAFGDIDYVPPDAIDTGEWYYTVTMVNNLGFMLPHIALFYKRRGLDGVVFLSADVIQPGEAVVFRLGICSEMESYSFGLFDDIDGDGEIELVLKFPETGNFTAEMGAARDGFACEDSFSLGG